MKSLDTSYFTSLSYYILLLFGSRGVMSLVFRDNVVDEVENMKRTQMMGMGGAGPSQPGFDMENQFKNEKTALTVVRTELTKSLTAPSA
jgi:ER membrane protein complex subunit 3